MPRDYLPVDLVRRVREAARHRCGYCLSPQRLVMARLEVEHVIPRARGGTDLDGAKPVVIPENSKTEDAPPPSGPFYSTWGPLDGPILAADAPPALGVVAEPGSVWPVGIAFPERQVEHRRGPARTFRLIIAKHELEGRWICVKRQFIRLGEAAEEI